MKPVADLPLRPDIRGLCFDIDDTFTTEGRLAGEAFVALERWQASGRLAIAVTGRPAGWCDHIARMWPVNAVVGENGALWFSFDHQARQMTRVHMQSSKDREKSRAMFPEVIARVLSRFPGARVAADQDYRSADLAIDFAEDCGPLTLADARGIAEIMREFEMNAKISSIHVNGWFGDFDKLTTTRHLAESRFGLDARRLQDDFLYIGDSPNDSPMFSYFSRSVGVANVRHYGGLLESEPKYVCTQESTRGFIEVIDHVMNHLS